MNHNDYHKIAAFLSSSEINRCKKNGSQWYEYHSVGEWLDYLKAEWLPRKLRRKLGHLYQLNILPVTYPKVTSLFNPADYAEHADLASGFYKGLNNTLAKQYLAAEDEAIMKGLSE